MRTDRWNKKRELNLYAFYDHTGLERHLEKMAANGWMLENPSAPTPCATDAASRKSSASRWSTTPRPTAFVPTNQTTRT